MDKSLLRRTNAGGTGVGLISESALLESQPEANLIRNGDDGRIFRHFARYPSLLGSQIFREGSMTAHASNFQNHQLRELIAEATGSTDAKSTDVGDISVCRVRTEIRNRRLRTRYFATDLFSDPAWDILLDLFQGELMQRRVSVSSACIGAAVPPTTALRWIASMVKRRMLVRHADPIDGRRVFVELSPDASLAMRLYFTNTVRS